MKSGLRTTEYNFPNQVGLYKGKVRDVYDLGEYLVMITSDRISAFDHILPRAIPYKGQVLTQIAALFLTEIKDKVPNWFLESPHPNVSIGYKCTPIPIEMVVRGYLAGHAWRTYDSGERVLCGVTMSDGLAQNDKFETPIITPATKAQEGHDIDISKEDMLAQNIVTKEVYEKMESYTKLLFEYGSNRAQERGLILVDTKYEFGIWNGEVMLIDEIHTPDSSRYFYSDRYKYNQDKGLPQEQLSKEFVREWLIANNFMGQEGEQMPDMPDDFVDEISNRYVHLYELITGETLIKSSYDQIEKDIENKILEFINSK